MTSSTEEEDIQGVPVDVIQTLPVLSVLVGEPYFLDYSVHKLPDSV